MNKGKEPPTFLSVVATLVRVSWVVFCKKTVPEPVKVNVI